MDSKTLKWIIIGAIVVLVLTYSMGKSNGANIAENQIWRQIYSETR